MTQKTEPPRLTADEVCDELYEESVRQHARQFGKSAIDNLAELAASGPRAVRRAASNDLLNHAKPAAKSKLGELADLVGGREIHIHFTGIDAGGEPPVEIEVSRAEEDLVPLPSGDVAEVEDAVPAEDPLMSMVVTNPAES